MEWSNPYKWPKINGFPLGHFTSIRWVISWSYFTLLVQLLRNLSETLRCKSLLYLYVCGWHGVWSLWPTSSGRFSAGNPERPQKMASKKPLGWRWITRWWFKKIEFCWKFPVWGNQIHFDFHISFQMAWLKSPPTSIPFHKGLLQPPSNCPWKPPLPHEWNLEKTHPKKTFPRFAWLPGTRQPSSDKETPWNLLATWLL